MGLSDQCVARIFAQNATAGDDIDTHLTKESVHSRQISASPAQLFSNNPTGSEPQSALCDPSSMELAHWSTPDNRVSRETYITPSAITIADPGWG